jgi:hypothetical protein
VNDDKKPMTAQPLEGGAPALILFTIDGAADAIDAWARSQRVTVEETGLALRWLREASGGAVVICACGSVRYINADAAAQFRVNVARRAAEVASLDRVWLLPAAPQGGVIKDADAGNASAGNHTE